MGLKPTMAAFALHHVMYAATLLRRDSPGAARGV